MVYRTDHFSTGLFLDKSIESLSRNRPVSSNSPFINIRNCIFRSRCDKTEFIDIIKEFDSNKATSQ